MTHETPSATAPSPQLPTPRGESAAEHFGTPHPQAGSEAWCLNGRLRAENGTEHVWVLCVFRHENPHDPDMPGYGLLFTHTGPEGVSSGTWITPALLRALSTSFCGDEAMDPRVRTALADVLAEGVPLPDRPLEGEVTAGTESLDLVLGDRAVLRRENDGSFTLTVRSEVELELRLIPERPTVPQYDACGHFPGRLPDGSDAFTSVFIPRLHARGRLRLRDGAHQRVEGTSWFEHDWGGHLYFTNRARGTTDHTWQWTGMRLDNGWDITAIRAEHTDPVTEKRVPVLTRATAVRPDGTVSYHDDLTWQVTRDWTSLATLETYPTTVKVSVPSLGLDVDVTGRIAGSENRTIMAGRSLWEADSSVCGTMTGTPVPTGTSVPTGTGVPTDTPGSTGAPVSGTAFLESVPSSTVGDVERYMRRISRISLTEAATVYPAGAETDATALHLLTGADTSPAFDGDTLDRLHQSLIAPLRHILDNPGRSWRPYISASVFCLLGVDPEPYRPLTAISELLHTASVVIDDIEDASLLRRGRPAVHALFGTPTTINAGTLTYLTFDPLLDLIPQHDAATMLRVHRLCLRALRTGHAGQALDLTGPRNAFEHAVATGDHHDLLDQVRTALRLKTGVPVRCMAEAAAVLAGATEEQISAVGRYFEAVGTSYQISDDVANLDGVTSAADRAQGRTSKTPAEDLINSRITYPVAHATGLLDPADRHRLRDSLYQGTPDGAAHAADLLTRSGALHASLHDSRTLVDQAWGPLQELLPPSQHKATIRALGWYAAQRQTDPATDPATEPAPVARS